MRQFCGIDIERQSYVPLCVSVSQTAVAVQLAIGDSIVWWRAWVLWPTNRVLNSTCLRQSDYSNYRCVCLWTSEILGSQAVPSQVAGALSTRSPCMVTTPGYHGSGAILFAGDLWGTIAPVVSLVNNVIATALIAYPAW